MVRQLYLKSENELTNRKLNLNFFKKPHLGYLFRDFEACTSKQNILRENSPRKVQPQRKLYLRLELKFGIILDKPNDKLEAC